MAKEAVGDFGVLLLKGLMNLNPEEDAAWSSNNIESKFGRRKVKYFVSQKPNFYLDGTWHPKAMLTNFGSKEGTLQSFLNDNDWPSRYLVEDLALVEDHPKKQQVTRRNKKGDGGSIAVVLPKEHQDALSTQMPFEPFRVLSNGETQRAVMRQFFASIGPTTTQLHRDQFDNLYLCLRGFRTWKVGSKDLDIEISPGSVSALQEEVSPPAARRGGLPSSLGFPRPVWATKAGQRTTNKRKSTGSPPALVGLGRGGAEELEGRGGCSFGAMDAPSPGSVEGGASVPYPGGDGREKEGKAREKKKEAGMWGGAREDEEGKHGGGGGGGGVNDDDRGGEDSAGEEEHQPPPDDDEEEGGLFLEVALGAGDALWVPAGTWHAVASRPSPPSSPPRRSSRKEGTAEPPGGLSLAVNWYFEPIAPCCYLQAQSKDTNKDEREQMKRRDKQEGPECSVRMSTTMLPVDLRGSLVEDHQGSSSCCGGELLLCADVLETSTKEGSPRRATNGIACCSERAFKEGGGRQEVTAKKGNIMSSHSPLSLTSSSSFVREDKQKTITICKF